MRPSTGEDSANGDFEFAHHGRGDLVNIDTAGAGQGLLQAAALIHCGGGDDAVLVGQRLHAL